MDNNLTRINKTLVEAGYISVPLRQNITGQLIVSAAINGMEGAYILDTGAGTTVIDSTRAGYLNVHFNDEETVQTGGGVGGHGIENVPSYNNKIRMSDFVVEDLTVAVMSLETAWASLASVGANDELFGIIGFDILKAGKAIIDYGSMTLYLKKE